MNKITLKEFEVLNTSNLDYAGVHGGTNKKWDVTEEEKKIKINVVKMNKTDMEFDLIGFDPALANAFRRILLAEIPSMAIEKVHIYQNTSIMQVQFSFIGYIFGCGRKFQSQLIFFVQRTRFFLTGSV